MPATQQDRQKTEAAQATDSGTAFESMQVCGVQTCGACRVLPRGAAQLGCAALYRNLGLQPTRGKAFVRACSVCMHAVCLLGCLVLRVLAIPCRNTRSIAQVLGGMVFTSTAGGVPATNGAAS